MRLPLQLDRRQLNGYVIFRSLVVEEAENHHSGQKRHHQDILC